MDTQEDFIFCTKCGFRNRKPLVRCGGCGAGPKASAAGPVVTGSDGTFGGLIPYKNSSALVSYYLGVFSLLPCIGILTGVVAVILGIRGLRYAEKHPEAKGQVHAWIGIVAGGGFAAVYLLLLLLVVWVGSTR